jgi:ferritin
MDMQMLQDQMNKERQNHAQYYAFAQSLEAANWGGFAAWMKKAAADELIHAGKFADYLIARNQVPAVTALEMPEALDGNMPVPFFQAALDLERANTASILAILEAGDGQTRDFLYDWAIKEQTESERTLVDALLELGRVDATGLLILDERYGEKATGA